MKKGLLICLLLTFCLTICPSSKASAWSYRIGDDGWWNGTHYNLDKFEFFMITDSTFADPSQTDFSAPEWNASLINPHYSLATGPGAGSLFWTFNFAGPSSQPITLDWLAYSEGELVGDARVTFTDSSFNYINFTSLNPNDPIYDRTSGVPITSTMLLLGSGLVALGLLGRRCQRFNTLP